jgi:hypothetical protein
MTQEPLHDLPPAASLVLTHHGGPDDSGTCAAPSRGALSSRHRAAIGPLSDVAIRQKVTIIPIRAIRGARIPKTWLAFEAF